MVLGKLRPTRKPAADNKIADDGGIYDGTVGWEDGKLHYDLVDGQIPLIKVTLFHGHNPVTEGENTTPDRAKGRQIVVRIDPKSSDIPDDGESVIVAVPKGRSNVPGSAMIIGRPNPDPKWIPNRKSGEKILFGPNDSFIRFKEDGTIFMFVKDGTGDDAKPIYFKQSKEGFELRHPYGKFRADQQGFGIDHASGAAITGGSLAIPVAPFDALASFITLRAAMVRLNATAVSIGPDGGAPDALLKSTPILGTMDSQQLAFAAIGAALAALITDLTTAGILTTTAAPLVTAAATAITASGSALTTCHIYAPASACGSA